MFVFFSALCPVKERCPKTAVSLYRLVCPLSPGLLIAGRLPLLLSHHLEVVWCLWLGW